MSVPARNVAAAAVAARIPRSSLGGGSATGAGGALGVTPGGVAAAAPRWPFLRNKSLTNSISRFIAPPTGVSAASDNDRTGDIAVATTGTAGVASASRCLWVTGSPGSGSRSAVQAVLGPLLQGRHVAEADPALVVIYDCVEGGTETRLGTDTAPRSGGGGGIGSGGATALKIVSSFEQCLVRQLSEQMSQAPMRPSRARGQAVDDSEERSLVEACARSVLQRHPAAAQCVVAAVGALAGRAGLAGAVLPGTELLGCREAVEKHRSDPVKIVMQAAFDVAAASPQSLLLKPRTALHACLALLRDAGARSAAEGGASPASLWSLEYLLSAADGLGTAAGREVVVALLCAETLSGLSASPVSAAMMTSLEAAAGRGIVKLVVQSRDGIAAIRAREEAGVEVLTADEWPEEMAKAVVVPRFLAADDEEAWRGVWSSVGGHAAHLRQVSELIVKENLSLNRSKMKAAVEKRRAEDRNSSEEERSPDAVAAVQAAEQAEAIDSLRVDARLPMEPPEKLLRRLPDVLTKEVAEFEAQAASFARHPLLGVWRASLGREADRPGQLVAALVKALQPICGPVGESGAVAAGDTATFAKDDVGNCFIAAPPGGLGELDDPLMLALLDVGLLVPKWSGPRGPRLVPANRLTQTLLAAWLQAQLADLGWQDSLESSRLLWRGSTSAASTSAKSASPA
eukprot:TRINITY_DN27254_c0_g1_i1.p1 TRINITY_DN27254_c0_g1~~TRINITY_DN27254_c0_g1_i1.p1  ORF type:complete len:685 (-),score=145.25 TRINITY_DN27254_c0_g1_i1:204-2258(-)